MEHQENNGPVSILVSDKLLHSVAEATQCIEYGISYLQAHHVAIPNLVAKVYFQEVEADGMVVRIVFTRPSDGFGILFCMEVCMSDETGYQQAAIEFWKDRLKEFGISQFCTSCGATYGIFNADTWLGADIPGDQLSRMISGTSKTTELQGAAQ